MYSCRFTYWLFEHAMPISLSNVKIFYGLSREAKKWNMKSSSKVVKGHKALNSYYLYSLKKSAVLHEKCNITWIQALMSPQNIMKTRHYPQYIHYKAILNVNRMNVEKTSRIYSSFNTIIFITIGTTVHRSVNDDVYNTDQELQN